MTYTTAELIEILDRELESAWKGKRIVLSSSNRINDPVVAKALNMDKVSKVFAYQDFRNQIHEYQKEHQVSGIIWRNSTFQGKTVCYPEIHNQLIPIPGDKQILVEAKKSILAFWEEVTTGMNFWLVGVPGSKTIASGDRYQPISSEYVAKLVKQAEWAEIDAAQTEVYLGLCWGDPQEYRYQWAKPKSGCDRIVASLTEPSLIKI
jgi:hypothetical protein